MYVYNMAYLRIAAGVRRLVTRTLLLRLRTALFIRLASCAYPGL